MSDPHPGSESFRVLHLEDDAADGELTEVALKIEWPRIRIERVTNRPRFLSALQGREHDVILSDYTVPGFSGLAALELARLHKPNTPFIFFSGTIGEDSAVEALKQGATDYVLKDRPNRLIPAIRRALNEFSVRGRGSIDGIAHGLNNALAPVFLALPLIRQQPIDADVRGLLDIVEESVGRGGTLLRQLQAVARGESAAALGRALEAQPPGVQVSTAGPGRGRTVLVIDDEKAVRTLTKAILESSGYAVIAATNGIEGLEAYRSHLGKIDAVLTDVTMPGMSGTQVVSEVRVLNPDARIVVMSGRGEPAGFTHEPGRLGFLRKPMTRSALLRSLQEVEPEAGVAPQAT